MYGIFTTEEKAVGAVDELTRAGFPTSAIGAALYDDSGVESLAVGQTSSVGRGAALGAAIGLGATALVGVGAGLFAAGPLLVVLEAMAAGGVVGSVTGAVAGLGFWRNVLELPSSTLESGAIVVGVETTTRSEEALQVLRSVGSVSTSATNLRDRVTAHPSSRE